MPTSVPGGNYKGTYSKIDKYTLNNNSIYEEAYGDLKNNNGDLRDVSIEEEEEIVSKCKKQIREGISLKQSVLDYYKLSGHIDKEKVKSIDDDISCLDGIIVGYGGDSFLK